MIDKRVDLIRCVSRINGIPLGELREEGWVLLAPTPPPPPFASIPSRSRINSDVRRPRVT